MGILPFRKYNVEEIETFIKDTNVDVWVVS
jgi:hypothetical protein